MSKNFSSKSSRSIAAIGATFALLLAGVSPAFADSSIGTTIAVTGVSDVTQLLVKGNATQTSNTFAVQTSALANLFTIANSGLTTIASGGLVVTAGGASITGASTITGTLGGLTGLTVASGGASITGATPLTLIQTAVAGGSPNAFVLTGGAHTALAASTEASDVNFNLARTVQFATGSTPTQRAIQINPPTYAGVGASSMANAATLAIAGAPVAGTNMTISNAAALWLQSGDLALGSASGYSHIVSKQAAAPTATGTCTTPGLAAGATDVRGTVTTASCTASQTVIVTFPVALSSAPVCVVSPANAAGAVSAAGLATMFASASTTALTITTPAAASTAGSWNYVCIQ